jgi:ribose 5-phosphate isomerase A
MVDAGQDEERMAAATVALAEVTAGMTLGLGTGRSAERFVRLLGERVRAGLSVRGVATSERTAELARAAGVPLVTLAAGVAIDLAIDGADEVDRRLRLIKGGGGALLREKIVASAAERMIVIAEEAKLVDTLGAFPLPIEIVSFGLAATRAAVERAAARLGLTGTIEERPLTTDGGHRILDASFGKIDDPEGLAAALDGVTGVVEHGLFIDLASAVILGCGGSATVRLEAEGR